MEEQEPAGEVLEIAPAAAPGTPILDAVEMGRMALLEVREEMAPVVPVALRSVWSGAAVPCPIPL